MLIPSHRHRPEDLSLWAEIAEADRIYPIPPQRISSTIDVMRVWDGDYIGCSWGKDSVVMLAISLLAKVKQPVVWVRMRGRDNPDCERVRDCFLNRFPMNYHERVFEYEQCGNDEHWKAVEAEFGKRRMTGIRAEESGRRKMSIRHLGKETTLSCRPLAWWRQNEIFAFLAQNNLPIHPTYAMLGGGRWPRSQLRTHGIGGKTGSNYGRTEWEREYYGDVLNRLTHF